MSNRSRGSADLVITTDDQQLRYRLAHDAKHPAVEPLELSPARLDEVVRNADVPRVVDNLDAGMGFSRRVEQVPNGYAYALPGFTRAPGGMFCPAGKLTSISLPGGGSPNQGITCSERFQTPSGTYLWLGTNGPDILVLSADGLSAVVQYSMTTPGWVTTSMAIFNNKLYVGSAVGLACIDGATGLWTETAALIRSYLAVVAWRPLGVPTDVLVGVSNEANFNAIRWCPITADPMSVGSWSAPVRVGGTGGSGLLHQVNRLVAAPQHVYMFRADGIWDMDELGARTFNIAPWIVEGLDVNSGFWGMHLGDGVYYNHAQGLCFVPTTGETIYRPEWCQPGWGLPYDGPVRGFANAGTLHAGWGLVGLLNTNGESFVCAGRREPDSSYGHATHTWHGAEAVVPGTIGYMRVWTHASTQPRLLIAWSTGLGTPTVVPHLSWQSLPKYGNPVQEMLWGGGFEPADAASLFLPADPYERPSAVKSLLQFELVTENMDLGSDLLKVYASSDTAPTWALQGQAEEGTYTRLLPLELVEGRYTSVRVDAVGHPILRSIDTRAALGVELREARTYRVILASDDALRHASGRENRDPQQRMDDLVALSGRVVTIDDGTSGGEPLRARVLQVMAGERTRMGTPTTGESWAIVATVLVSLLDHPFRYSRGARYDTDRTWR